MSVSMRQLTCVVHKCRLCNVRFTTVRVNLHLEDVTINSRSGDFNATSLAHVVDTDTVNRLVLQTWLDRAGAYLHATSTS